MNILRLRPKKTEFTRKCIGEAVVYLLKGTDLQHLKVFAVALKAGVSRMTFYKYYASPQDALEDYLQIIISEFIEEHDDGESGVFTTFKKIVSAFNFFDRYRNYFLTMKRLGLYNILIDSVNKFVTEYLQFPGDVSIYKIYSYAGSLLNSFLMWEDNDRKEPVEEVARAIEELFGSASAEAATV